MMLTATNLPFLVQPQAFRVVQVFGFPDEVKCFSCGTAVLVPILPNNGPIGIISTHRRIHLEPAWQFQVKLNTIIVLKSPDKLLFDLRLEDNVVINAVARRRNEVVGPGFNLRLQQRHLIPLVEFFISDPVYKLLRVAAE